MTVLEAAEAFPDAVFIEDTAVITPQYAVITNPVAESRKGEEQSICEVLARFIPHIVIHVINVLTNLP